MLEPDKDCHEIRSESHSWRLKKNIILLYLYTFQEMIQELQQFNKCVYEYAVAAMKEDITFDDVPDEYKG